MQRKYAFISTGAGYLKPKGMNQLNWNAEHGSLRTDFLFLLTEIIGQRIGF